LDSPSFLPGRWSRSRRAAWPVPGDGSTMTMDVGTFGEERTVRRRTKFTKDEARLLGTMLGVGWDDSPFAVEQFRQGLDVELEHGRGAWNTNVTDDDPVLTAKIALAHLRELPDYYTRLARMEADGEAEQRRESVPA
jgi:hypothetical protein